MYAPHPADPTGGGDALRLRKPPIMLNIADRERLEVIAFNALLQNPRIAALLLDEIDRAEALPAGDPAQDHVGLGSWVRYRDIDRGQMRSVRIVKTARPDRELELGVLSPLGVALIGLAAGQSIIASDRRGTEWLVEVLSVTRAHESAP
jgi:regulator of nucleoside diphosphate kinase